MATIKIPAYRETAMKFSTFATEYLQHLASPLKGFSSKTTESYDLTYRQFLAYVLGKGLTDDVRQFTPENVQGFIEYLAKNGIGANSINVKLAGLSSLGQRAMKVKNGKDYIVDVNPVDRVERPRKVRPVRKFLHREEISKVLSLEAPENEALARDLFFDTGLRVSEIANASVHDLRVTGDGTVILGASVKGRGRTLEKVDIPLGKHVGERLMAQLQEREAGPKDPIIVNREGRRYTRTTLSEMVMRMGKKAGIDRMNVRPHAIRHTYNVLARQAGVDVATRAKLLNHTDTNTLQRYDHVLPEETRAARDVVRQEVLRG